MIGSRALALALTLTTASTGFAAPEPAPDPPPPTLVAPAPPLAVEVDPAHYRMVLAGNIVIGVGGLSLVAMLVGLGLRSDAQTRRRALGVAILRDPDAIAVQDRRLAAGTTLSIAGGAAAGALFVAGISLVALGYSRERKRRATLTSPSQLAPMLDRERVGLSWLVRF